MTYACDCCAKKYTDRSNLLRHKRIAHSGNRYVCKTCGKHFTRKFKLTSHKYVTKEDEAEQEKLAEETGPLPKQRRKTNVSSQSKPVVERKLRSESELKNEDTSMQPEESEKETQANEDNLNECEKTTKEHATDKEILAQDDEADFFQSFESMTDHHWKSRKTFSKQGSVQDIFNFYINNDLFSLKNDFLDMFYKQTCRFKKNFSFGFILRNRNDNSFRYWHASNGVDRILDHPQLISNFFDFETFLNKVFVQDMLEKARLSRPNSSWVVEVVSNITFFINKLKEHPIGCGINLPDFIVNNTGLHALQKNYKNGKLYLDNLCLF